MNFWHVYTTVLAGVCEVNVLYPGNTGGSDVREKRRRLCKAAAETTGVQ